MGGARNSFCNCWVPTTTMGANHNQLVDFAQQSSQVLDDLNSANIQQLEKFLIVKDVDYRDYESE